MLILRKINIIVFITAMFSFIKTNTANALIECSPFFPSFHIDSQDPQERLAFEKIMSKDTAQFGKLYFHPNDKVLYDDQDVKQRIVDQINAYAKNGEQKLDMWLQPYEAVTAPELSKEGKTIAYTKKCIYKLYFGEDNVDKGNAKSIAKVELQATTNNSILASIGKNIADMLKELGEFVLAAVGFVSPTTKLVLAMQKGDFNQVRESLNELSTATENFAKEGRDVINEGEELVSDVKLGVMLAKDTKEQ